MPKQQEDSITRFAILVLFSILTTTMVFGCAGSGTNGSECGEGPTPTVVSTVPSDGAAQVHPATDIVVNFNVAMDKPSVILNTSISPVASSVSNSWYSSDTQMVLIPAADLQENTTYTVTIGPDSMSVDSVPMAVGYDLSFTTGDVAQADMDRPVNQGTGVSTATTISISFTEPMDTDSVEENFSLSWYDDDISYAWSGGSTMVTASLASPLESDRTYTVTLSPMTKDAEGTVLGSAVTFVFSTGDQIAAGSIAGTIDDDPDSEYDDRIYRTYVGLYWYDFSSGEGGKPTLTQCDLNGDYQFSYLDTGDYYVRAFQDTNWDGLVGNGVLRSGDALGVYEDLLSGTADSVAVSGAARTGIDFSLYDPEAISGDLEYVGANTTDAYASTAYAVIYQGLSGASISTAQAEFINDPTDPYWHYDLNPLLDDGQRLNPGSYNVGAFIDLDGDGSYTSGEPAGFYAETLQIRDAGEDELGVDFTLYDSITISGTVRAVDSIYIDPAGDDYEDAFVSLLGTSFGDNTDAFGDYELESVPLGSEQLYLNVRPAATDEETIMTANSMYRVFETSDAARAFNFIMLSQNAVAQYASLCNVTVQPSDAQIVGSIRTSGGLPETGYEVEIDPGNDVFYIGNGTGTCSTGISTVNEDGGIQFFIFNSCKDTYTEGEADIVIPGCTTVTIPVVEDQLTYVDIICDP
jgi:hypothetical protein